MRTVGSVLLTLSLAASVQGQQRQAELETYAISLTIPDTGTVIHGSAAVLFFRRVYDTLRLDLVKMQVDTVWRVEYNIHTGQLRTPVPYRYDGRVITVPADIRGISSLEIHYHGAPEDGLIIGSNSYGRRVVFADNWPERARYWIPTFDHPVDKASVTFNIRIQTSLISPSLSWRVVSNGKSRRFFWSESHRIPTYTMVFGAGEFSVSEHRPAVDGRDTIPIEVWTYREDSSYADSVPFRRATEIVEVMQRLIGPFPYENLKHVESSTRFGGMENASAIFYAEKPYVERKMGEGVVRHETAHQWFGDAVTERDWPHLWLSEGFATYFDGVIGAALDGDSVLVNSMRADAESYFKSDVTDRPIVDSGYAADPIKLLNANSYPKGAWVLHMLRGTIGDSAFFRGLRTYYRTYRDSTATSADFQRVIEKEARANLGWFFHQWLYQPGYPQLDVTWQYDAGARKVLLGITQRQKPEWGMFRLPLLTLEFRGANGATVRRDVAVRGDSPETSTRVDLPFAPTEVRVDPDGKLLLRVTIGRR